jgi:hypothetical protein
MAQLTLNSTQRKYPGQGKHERPLYRSCRRTRLTTPIQVVNGLSDNLLTSVIRAWDTDASIDNKRKTILVAPAMNSVTHLPLTPKKQPATATNYLTLRAGHVEAPRHREAAACAVRRLGRQERQRLVQGYFRESVFPVVSANHTDSLLFRSSPSSSTSPLASFDSKPD